MHWTLFTKDVVVFDLNKDTVLLNFGNFTLQSTVVDQDLGSNLNSVGKCLISGRHSRIITLDSLVHHDLVLLSSLQLNWFALLELASEHGWPLGVHHDAHGLVASFFQHLRQRLHVDPVRLLQKSTHSVRKSINSKCKGPYLDVTIFEVKSSNVHACIKHLVHLLVLLTASSQSSNNGCFPLVQIDLLKDVLEPNPTGVLTDWFASCFDHLDS